MGTRRQIARAGRMGPVRFMAFAGGLIAHAVRVLRPKKCAFWFPGAGMAANDRGESAGWAPGGLTTPDHSPTCFAVVTDGYSA